MEPFVLSYEGFDPEAEGLSEVLASTGNGRFCARGAAESADRRLADTRVRAAQPIIALGVQQERLGRHRPGLTSCA